MPNYYDYNYDYNRGNEYPSQRNSQRKPYYVQGMQNREQSEKSSDDLIIDGNSVYEIDPDCYERIKQLRLSKRQDWNRR